MSPFPSNYVPPMHLPQLCQSSLCQMQHKPKSKYFGIYYDIPTKKLWRGQKGVFVLTVPMPQRDKEVWDEVCFMIKRNSLLVTVNHISTKCMWKYFLYILLQLLHVAKHLHESSFLFLYSFFIQALCLKTIKIDFAFVPIPVSKSLLELVTNTLHMFVNEFRSSITKLPPKYYGQND